MTTTKTFSAVYERESSDDAWNVRIDGIEGCQTYGRSLRQAQARIREALAVCLDRDPDHLVVHDRLPESLALVAEGLVQARREAERAGATAQAQTLQAVKELTSLGLSRRDAAELLGLSHQRIQQLLEAG